MMISGDSKDAMAAGQTNLNWDGLPANQMSTSLKIDNLICWIMTSGDIKSAIHQVDAKIIWSFLWKLFIHNVQSSAKS